MRSFGQEGSNWTRTWWAAPPIPRNYVVLTKGRSSHGTAAALEHTSWTQCAGDYFGPHAFPQNDARQYPDIIRFDYMHIDRRRAPVPRLDRARGGGLPERVSLEYAFPDLIVACINDLPFSKVACPLGYLQPCSPISPSVCATTVQLIFRGAREVVVSGHWLFDLYQRHLNRVSC